MSQSMTYKAYIDNIYAIILYIQNPQVAKNKIAEDAKGEKA
jgi:hypothetical protein